MKKVYEKPQVYMERFELSQNVAVCDYRLGAGAPETCSITKDIYEGDYADLVGGFVDVNQQCTQKVSIYCYTSGADGMPSTFMS